MRTLLTCTLSVFVLALTVSADDKKDEKIDAKLLIGKWEPKEQKDGRKFVMEFLKDGKLTLTRTADEKTTTSEGTYKVDGAKLTVSMRADGKDETDTRLIAKLTDAEFVTTGTGDTKEFTMVRVKDKK